MILRNRFLIALYVRKRYVLVVAALCVAGALAYIRLYPDEEKRVRGRLDLLAERVTKKGGEGTLVLMRRAQSVGVLFSEECEIRSKYQYLSGVFNSRDTAQLVAQFHTEVTDVTLSFENVKVRFPQKTTAEVLAAGKMRGTVPGDEPFAENHGVLFKLQKIDDKWLFTEVRIFDGPSDMKDEF